MPTNHEKHTPGPWKADPSTGDVTSAADDDIAFVYSARRDLSLIAAAPEMYDALKTLENDNGAIPPWLWDLIQAAIAKAEGK